MDRLIFAALYQFVPSVINALAIVKPDTVSLPKIISAHVDDVGAANSRSIGELLMRQLRNHSLSGQTAKHCCG
jgi:hypothetical protein